MEAGVLSSVLSVFFVIHSIAASASNASHALEDPICGRFKEPFVFWLWNSTAGKPNPDRLKHNDNIKDISLKTVDGKILRGYQLSSSRKEDVAGYLLVAQGNAMLADQIVDSFSAVSNAGYDVFVFDFRGYGRSEGKRRLRAILSDYREIKNYLDTLQYKNRSFYGMSFGGIVLLDALQDDNMDKIVVIDSVPSTVSDRGCPTDHDPINTVSSLSGTSLFIFGDQDRVVTRKASLELSERAKDIAQKVLVIDYFGHPFMDGNANARMNMIREFLKFNQRSPNTTR